MRPDMFKVVVERPRRGSRNSYGNIRHATNRARDLEDLPAKEGMQRPYRQHGDWKDLNENLSPLKRYLYKQVGRKWDDVYSDICEHINSNSTVQKHVLDHVFDYVTKHVFIQDGKVYENRRFWRGLYEADGLYVHPETGILLDGTQPRKRYKPKVDPDVYQINGIEYRRVNGCWFETIYEALPEPFEVTRYREDGEPHKYTVRQRKFDVVKKAHVQYDRWARITHYAASKRQLSGKELRRLGLVNAS